MRHELAIGVLFLAISFIGGAYLLWPEAFIRALLIILG